MKRLFPLALLPLAACAAQPQRVETRAVAAPAFNPAGLERVLGQDAAGLTRLFGEPDADYREGPGRKLQFESQLCVIDAYLYPKGAGERSARIRALAGQGLVASVIG